MTLRRLVNNWTRNETPDTPIEKTVENARGDDDVQVEVDGEEGCQGDANRRDGESEGDRFWLYREAARFGLSFDLCL